MTAAKSTIRPRRRTADSAGIPKALARWFGGADPAPPWCALLPGDYELLPERWAVWKAAYPGAVAPVGFEWLSADD